MIWQHMAHFFGIDENHKSDVPPQGLSETPTIKPPNVQPVITESLLDYCHSIISVDLAELPIMNDSSRWWDVMPDWYGNIWRRNYAASLERAGVLTVGDLALLITTLKLYINWVEDGYPLISFANPGPDGTIFKV